MLFLFFEMEFGYEISARIGRRPIAADAVRIDRRAIARAQNFNSRAICDLR